MDANPANLVPHPRPPRPTGGRRWPLIVVGLLVGHVSLMVVAVVLATRDKSFAVLPDYYQRAVRWDAEQAERRAGERLGWQCTITPTDRFDRTGARVVELTLVDADGRPLANADVRVAYFAHARSAQRAEATFRTDARGAATGPMRLRAEGFYEMGVTATHDGRRFVRTTTQYVTAPAPTTAATARGAS